MSEHEPPESEVELEGRDDVDSDTQGEPDDEVRAAFGEPPIEPDEDA